MHDKKKHQFPPLPRRRKHLKAMYAGFPFYTDYSRATVAAGDVNSPMAQGVSGPDIGGMGESACEETHCKDMPNSSEKSKNEETWEFETNEPEKKSAILGSVNEEGSKDEDESDSEKDTPYKFSCAMLNLNPKVASIVDHWVKKNIPKESLYIDEDHGHDGYEEVYHVTLKYGIHDSSPDKLAKLVHGFGPIPFNFGPVEKFEPEFDAVDKNNKEKKEAAKFDVIHIKIVDSDILRQVNELISENIENTETYSSYKPHITLAYVKKGSCDALIGNTFFDTLSDEVDEIFFNSKDGKEHYISLELE